VLVGWFCASRWDGWVRVWRPEDGGGFTVKSCYKLLERLFLLNDEVSVGEEVVFSSLWKCRAPSKVLAFSCTLQLDRIPTRMNLPAREVLEPDSSNNYVFCRRRGETAVHLFIHCEVVSRVRLGVMSWLQFSFITPHNLFVHFECWENEAKSKKLTLSFRLIWNASIWAIWNMRNEIILINDALEVEELVERIKRLSWF